MCLVDVIVPVHGAGPVFRRCAASLIAHGDVAFKLVIVLDGPPDVESLAAVEDLRAAAQRQVGGFELSVLTNDAAIGFLRSANRALRYSTRDVVLLNSDTQVTSGWLGRLRAAAYSDPKVATVTPFSNNATICSLPRFLDENAIPAGYTIDSFGALVTRVSRREYPRLPTGVGFCLYVKRSVLDEVGLFDEAFGLGYGEEVDLCLRAARRGYVHVLDDSTFIFHEGSRSFGSKREQHMRRGERVLLSRFPNYLRDVAEFIKNDPIALARARVFDELARSWELDEVTRSGVERAGPAAAGTEWPQRVLHLVPGWPPWTAGGAAMALRRVLRDQSARREVFVYARIADPDRADGSAVEYLDGGIRVRLIVANGAANGSARDGLNRVASAGAGDGNASGGTSGGGGRIASGTRRSLLSRLGVRPDPVGEDFARFLGDVRPDVVHVHDLAGGTLDLIGSARMRTIRAALKNVHAFVMGSQSLADSYAAARVLPRSAHVVVSPSSSPTGSREARDVSEAIERVYAEIMTSRSRR